MSFPLQLILRPFSHGRLKELNGTLLSFQVQPRQAESSRLCKKLCGKPSDSSGLVALSECEPIRQLNTPQVKPIESVAEIVP